MSQTNRRTSILTAITRQLNFGWKQSVWQSNIGFSAKELNKLQFIVQENQQILLEAWYGYFGNSSG
jgi:hypothetical protein